jgi:hypothetical protein
MAQKNIDAGSTHRIYQELIFDPQSMKAIKNAGDEVLQRRSRPRQCRRNTKGETRIMQFAFSTVLGGMPVYATDCTYDDTIELLTTCPICSSAVHLRSASERTYKESGKTIISNPYFAHYKAGNATDYDCTARCKSTEGQQILQRQEDIFKGQRLEWYNNRLWSVVAEHLRITPQETTMLMRVLGIGTIRQRAKNWRKNYRNNRPRIIQVFQSYGILYEDLEVKLAMCEPSDVSCQATRSYIYSVDRKLHVDICMEIMDFIATPSGGYALEKFIPASIVEMHDQARRFGRESVNLETWQSLDLEAETEVMTAAICSLVLSTHWINWFYPRQNNETPVGRKSLAT